MQVLDVWTTYRGVKYSCVVEKNPMLNEKPTVRDMVELKLGVAAIVGATGVHQADGLERWSLYPATFITGLVVVNNLAVHNRAQRKYRKGSCPKM